MRLISLIVLTSVLALMVGCNSDGNKNENLNVFNQKHSNENYVENNIKKEENDKKDLKQKLKEKSYSSESNPKELTMEESLKYVKSVLPKGIEEVESKFEKEVGVTEVIYKCGDSKFEVRYMHPYKQDGNMVDEYDLNKTVGISFKELDK